jgi:hypothetical protein
MGNVETKYDGRRGRKEPVTMRILQREVQNYREYNDNFMKYQEEIPKRVNMMQRKSNKDSSTKQTTSARQVTTSISHRKRYDHGNDIYLRCMSMHHNSSRKYIRRAHASLELRRIPSVSLVMR